MILVGILVLSGFLFFFITEKIANIVISNNSENNTKNDENNIGNKNDSINSRNIINKHEIIIKNSKYSGSIYEYTLCFTSIVIYYTYFKEYIYYDIKTYYIDFITIKIIIGSCVLIFLDVFVGRFLIYLASHYFSSFFGHLFSMSNDFFSIISSKLSAAGYLNLLADSMHNFTDGIAIGE